MNKNYRLQKIAYILIIITLTSLCQIVAAHPAFQTTPNFLKSQHYKQYIITDNDHLHYKITPNLSIILNYISAQSPQPLNTPNSNVYLNDETIAYSRKLTQDEICKKYPDPTKFTTLDTIATNLHSLPDEDILIEKIPENNNPLDIFSIFRKDNQIGIFINTKTLKKLEPKLKTNFSSIQTFTEVKYPSFIRTFTNEELVNVIYNIKIQ